MKNGWAVAGAVISTALALIFVLAFIGGIYAGILTGHGRLAGAGAFSIIPAGGFVLLSVFLWDEVVE